MDADLWELLEDGQGGDEIAAIIRLGHHAVFPQGVRVITQFGDIVTVRMRRSDIPRVNAASEVADMVAGDTYFGPDLETAAEAPVEALPLEVRGTDERRPPDVKATGKGVVIGVVDWGFDFAHPDFRNTDGSTRILALWDQRVTNKPGAPQPFGYGTLHDRDAINAALRQSDPYKALGYHPADADSGGGAHGTHVASIAGATGGGERPEGIAPEAEFVFVQNSPWGEDNSEKLGDSVTLLEAIDFIARTAGDRPWVINLSMGRHGEQHDGTTLIEQGLDAAVRAAAGRAVCMSTGNYFDKRIHAAGQLRPTERREFAWEVDEPHTTDSELEIWYSWRDRFEVEVRTADGGISARAKLGERAALRSAGKTVGNVYHRAREPNSLDNHINVYLYPAAPAGEWIVTLVATDSVDGRYHAWIERNAACPRCQTRFRIEDAVPTSTTGTICNGLRTIAVGAYNKHDPQRRVAHFSSVGPTRDGRLKPDLCAPGVDVLAARSAPRDAKGDVPNVTRMRGTSMAAPHVTGAVALMFSAAPRRLRIEETRNLLLESTERVSVPEEIPARVGMGYLDVTAAVEAARSVADLGPTPRVASRPAQQPSSPPGRAAEPPHVPPVRAEMYAERIPSTTRRDGESVGEAEAEMETEAAPAQASSEGSTMGRQSLPFQVQLPIGGGAPSLAVPLGGSPFAVALPLGGAPAPAAPPAAPAAQPTRSDPGDSEAIEAAFGESVLIAADDCARLDGAAPAASRDLVTLVLGAGGRSYDELPTANSLFHAFAYDRGGYTDRFRLVARPGDSLQSLEVRSGDLLVRVAPGEDWGVVAILASPQIASREELLEIGLRPEGHPAPASGSYVRVVEISPRRRASTDGFARRVADARGLVLPDTLLLRPLPIGRVFESQEAAGPDPDAPPTVIQRFRLHSDDVAQLPVEERNKITEIASAIFASFAAGAQRIRVVRLVGFADRDPQGPLFEWRISDLRAEAVRLAIEDAIGDRSITDQVDFSISGAGATHLVVPSPVNEDQRARNRRVEVTLLTTPQDFGWESPISSAPGQFVRFHARAQFVDEAGTTALGPPVFFVQPGIQRRAPRLPVPAGVNRARVRLEVTAEWPASRTSSRVEHARGIWDWSYDRADILHDARSGGQVLLQFAKESNSSVGQRFTLNPESTETTFVTSADFAPVEGSFVQGTAALVSRDEADRWRFDFRVALALPETNPAPPGQAIGGPPPSLGPNGGLLVSDASDWGNHPVRGNTSSVEFKATAFLRVRGQPDVVREYGASNRVELPTPASALDTTLDLRVLVNWRKHDLDGVHEGQSGVAWRWQGPQRGNLSVSMQEVFSFGHQKGLQIDLKDTPRIAFTERGTFLAAAVRVTGDTGSFKQTFSFIMPGGQPSPSGTPSGTPTGPATSRPPSQLRPGPTRARETEGEWDALVDSAPAVSEGRAVIDQVPLLRAHRGTPPDLILKWNAMASMPQSVDVVVHLHGFSDQAEAMRLDHDKERLSGLDFTDPDAPGTAGRTAPTLCVLPRGNFYGGRSGHGYDFPALITQDGLRQLVAFALSQFATRVGSPSVGIGRLIVTAHSGGGAPLMHIVQRNDPHEVHVFDALYGDAQPLIAWVNARLARSDSAGSALRVLYRPGTGTEAQSQLVAAALAAALRQGDPRANRYRVEATSVDHNHIPRRFGWHLLRDAGESLSTSASTAPSTSPSATTSATTRGASSLASGFPRRLADVAMDQFRQYHAFQETDPPLTEQIRQYWTGIGLNFPGVATAWSAVFVSWCVKEAGATASEFHFAAAHSVFVHAAIRNQLSGTGVFRGRRVTEYAPKIGDIIQNNRSGHQFDYDYASTHSSYESHSAIVVEEGTDEHGPFVVTVGGNESNSVRRRMVRLGAGGLIENPQGHYICVIQDLKGSVTAGTAPSGSTPTPSSPSPQPTASPTGNAEYVTLYSTCVIDPTRASQVDRIVQRIVANRTRYEAVSTATGVPWYFIGIVHSLEGGNNFSTHLHNGDPLTARTVHVPAGRPATGSPPFTWEVSATDALHLEHLDTWTDWTLGGVLNRMERYNGLGYRRVHPPIHSPYLWSFSNHYTRGKFVADGHYDPSAVSQQVGGAVLLLRMEQTNVIAPPAR